MGLGAGAEGVEVLGFEGGGENGAGTLGCGGMTNLSAGLVGGKGASGVGTGAPLSARAGSQDEMEEQREVSEEDTEAPGDLREQTRSGFRGLGDGLPGEAGGPTSPLGGSVGVPLWLE